jgi:hypothetical protein
MAPPPRSLYAAQGRRCPLAVPANVDFGLIFSLCKLQTGVLFIFGAELPDIGRFCAFLTGCVLFSPML